MDERSFNVELGRYLGRLFADAGYSQQQIVAETGIAQPEVSRDLSIGRRTGIKPERLTRYLEVLKVNLADVTANVLADHGAGQETPALLKEQIARATELLEDADDIREVSQLLTRQYFRRTTTNRDAKTAGEVMSRVRQRGSQP